MGIRVLLLASVLTAAHSLVALSQSRDVAANMSCADYLKAEQASGWSNGVTGSPSADQSSEADARRIHDFCTAHPNENAAAAIDKAKQDPSQDATSRIR